RPPKNAVQSTQRGGGSIRRALNFSAQRRSAVQKSADRGTKRGTERHTQLKLSGCSCSRLVLFLVRSLLRISLCGFGPRAAAVQSNQDVSSSRGSDRVYGLGLPYIFGGQAFPFAL